MTSFTGKILCVDLTAGTSESVSVPPEVYEAVLAGKGLEAWYLYNHIPAGADPLGPENVLAFAAGALCGPGAFLTGRWSVACKSPLTGGWGDANCGGLFAPAIKQCGYDAIFLSGVSDRPVYLFCDEKHARICDASAYWGLDAVETERALHEDLDPVCRKKPVFDYLECVSCGICAQACPVSVLGMRKEGRSGKYRNLFPEPVRDGCVGCGLCARACPMDAIRMEEVGVCE